MRSRREFLTGCAALLAAVSARALPAAGDAPLEVVYYFLPG